MTVRQDLITEGVKAVPAGTTLTLSLFGIPISGWAGILSIVLLLCQLFFLFRNNLSKTKVVVTAVEVPTDATKP